MRVAWAAPVSGDDPTILANRVKVDVVKQWGVAAACRRPLRCFHHSDGQRDLCTDSRPGRAGSDAAPAPFDSRHRDDSAGSDAAPSDTEIGGWQYGFHLTRPNDGTIDGCVFRGNFASSEAQQSLTHAIHVETSDYACNLLVNNCMRIQLLTPRPCC